MEKMTGKVWVLGDDIDTDIIIPTEYLALKTIDDMKQYGFSPLRPELAAQIKPGDIIVVDASGDMTNAIIGEIILRYAMSRSLGGFVIDGAIRDTSAILSAGFPVFASGVTHRGPYKDGPGEIGVPVSVGGMVVSSGDIVIGDTDGLIAVPQSHAEEILVLATAQQDREAAILQSIADGTIDRSWIDQTLKSKGV